MKLITTGVLLMGDLSAKDLASLARRLEDWGYDYIWLADERFFREIYSSLTLCALNTKNIQLGVCVTDPYSRHPALTAMAISTLDEISEGRAVLGIGAGVSGFGELGIDRARPALAMREMVGLIRKLMTGERVDFQGRMVQFNHGALNFTPIRADLPIYVASNGPRGLQVAGELADGALDWREMVSALKDAGYDGYLGMESVRGDDGVGITVCYWESREAIEAWGLDPEHQEAQREGLARWYDHITLRIGRVERFSEYTRPVAGAEGAAQGVE